MRLSKNFTLRELRCRHCGAYIKNVAFIEKLQALRDECGFPFIVTSWYRCPEYNNQVSRTGMKGPHTTGRAIDIAVHGADAFKLVELAPRHGFTGIGVKQNGPFKGRFIHIDDLESPFPRPWIWSY